VPKRRRSTPYVDVTSALMLAGLHANLAASSIRVS